MSSSCERRPRARVLRGSAAAGVELAPFGIDLSAGGPAPISVAMDAALEDGRRAGFEEGLADGRAVARQEIAARTEALARAAAALDSAAEALAARQADALRALEDDIAGAALELARAVVGREVATSDSPGRDALARALALVPPTTAALARLHPADLETLEASNGLEGRERGPGADGFAEQFAGRQVTLVADEGVEPGGCVVEAGDARIDAQLGAALERAGRLLLSGGEGA